ncbi:MAG: hypothetical protein N2606_02685 [Candidatus Omnitrophica bacterium]|nr:hypothetical protein [Candidatus Omnitrophota bacterium]
MNTISRLTRKIIIVLLAIKAIYLGNTVFAQQDCNEYCIDQSEYTSWMATNVKGAEDFYSASRYVGRYSDINSCEIARRSTLVDDVNWQRMTRCVCCRFSASDGLSGRKDLLDRKIEFDRKIADYKRQLFSKHGEKALEDFEKIISQNKNLPNNLEELEIILQTIYSEVVAKYQKNDYIKSRKQQEKEKISSDKKDILGQIKLSQVSNLSNTNTTASPNNLKISYQFKQKYPVSLMMLETAKQPAQIEDSFKAICEKIQRWNSEEISSSVLDIVSEKSGLPFDKLEKALSVGKLMNETVVEPVMRFLDEVKLALNNEAKWKELVDKSFAITKDAQWYIEKESQLALTRESLEKLPVVGGLLSKFFSAYKQVEQIQ